MAPATPEPAPEAAPEATPKAKRPKPKPEAGLFGLMPDLPEAPRRK